MKKSSSILALLILVSSVGQAKPSVFTATKVNMNKNKSCPLNSIEDVSRWQELSKGWESLPRSVLVAKEVRMVVDGENFHFESAQNFLKPGTEPVVCQRGEISADQRFSLLAPTLIDGVENGKVGSSVWNFQILSSRKKIKVWNTQSRGFTEAFELAKVFKDQGASEKYYRGQRNEYALIATKDSGGKSITLTVVFDSVDQLD